MQQSRLIFNKRSRFFWISWKIFEIQLYSYISMMLLSVNAGFHDAVRLSWYPLCPIKCYLSMKKNSRKEEYPYSQRNHNHSITSASSSKIPIPRQNTLAYFYRQKPLIELPRIFPIHNNQRHKRYMDSCLIDQDADLNLIGTKFMRRLSRQKNHFDTGDTVPTRNERSLLEKQESHKQSFLNEILNDNFISSVHFKNKQKITVFVDEGNNSRLIKELVRRRVNLRLISDKKDANIVWTQFCDWEQANMGSRFTESNKIDRQPWENQQTQQGSYQNKLEQVEGKGLQKPREVMMISLRMHNHFKNHYQISDKKCLFKNIKKLCKCEKINQHDIIPKTYHIDGNEADLPLNICEDQKFWIVKPGEDTNRGTGITVQQGRPNILKAVRQLAALGKSSLIQEYIDPLLYKNRKFDIRCYALITSVCGNLKAYWYREGYLRTCCKQFNYDPANIYGHLTNDAVQKKHKDYGKYQPYNKLSFTELEAILKSNDISYFNTIARMKELALISIRSAEDKLKSDKNMLAFQIFGYDFLIDSSGKLWLIEINTNPCLEFSGSLLSRIIWHLVENSLAIAIDPLLMQLPQAYNSWREKMGKIYQDNKFQCII